MDLLELSKRTLSGEASVMVAGTPLAASGLSFDSLALDSFDGSLGLTLGGLLGLALVVALVLALDFALGFTLGLAHHTCRVVATTNKTAP